MGHTRKHFFRGGAICACLLALVISWACSGGGSSGGGIEAEGVYGKVGVLITDAPSHEYGNIWITITEISLLTADCDGYHKCCGEKHDRDRECHDVEDCCDRKECCCDDGGCDHEECDDDQCGFGECDDERGDDTVCDPGDEGEADCGGKAVTIFSSEEGYTLDLLQYRDEDFLLLINEEVPAGRYQKIRMRISGVRAEGGPCEDMEIKLPSGRVDLNPGSPIDIDENELIYLRLDIDVNKSIHLHPSGSSKCIFRPVVFVDILTKDDLSQCPTLVTGEVKELHDESGDWVPESLTLRREGSTADNCLGDIRVCFAEDTLIFTADGVFGSPADLEKGQSVTVRGMTREGCFTASLIIIGDCRSVKGVIEEIPGFTEFLLSPDSCDGADSPIKVMLADETLLSTGCDTLMDPDALEAGMRVLVIGRLDDKQKTLAAALVIILTDEIEGTAAGVECGEDGCVFLLDTGADQTREIFVPKGARIALEGDGPVPDGMIQLLSCRSYHIRIFQGHNGMSEVLITPESVTGVVEKIYPYSRTLQVGGLSVQVISPATGVYISEKGDTLVSFDVLQPGDEITCFGLKACDDDLEDFHAFVFLVEKSG